MSTPRVRPYNFTMPQYAPAMLAIGSSIQDLADGSNTVMKRAHADEQILANRDFEIAKNEYSQKHAAASTRAEEAKREIDLPTRNKAIAITCLAACIIFTIGPILAAALTGTWLIAIGAAPFLIGLVPASYYTHIFRKQVSQLESDIVAPKALPTPVKRAVRPYIAAKDLDLRSSRVSAVNQLAAKSLKEIRLSGFSSQQIIDYHLLDGVAIPQQYRPEFYTRTVYLLDALTSMDRQEREFTDQIDARYRTLAQELQNWKSGQESSIAFRELGIYRMEQRNREDLAARVQPGRRRAFVIASNTVEVLSKLHLENEKREFYSSVGRWKAEINGWRAQSMQAIAHAHQLNEQRLESAYLTMRSIRA